VGASLLLAALMLLPQADNSISRIDAVLLLAGFAFFMYQTLKGAQGSHVDEPSERKNYSVGKAIFFIILGLVCLVGGSVIFVDGAKAIASELGVSEAVIGLTIVAGGTSLPELATSVVAAVKGKSDIAIGNVIGSNVFNILMILGLTGIICPMKAQGITVIDLGVLLLSAVLLWLFSFTKYKVERWEGALLAAAYVGYTAWLIANAI